VDSLRGLIDDNFVQFCWPFIREISYVLKQATGTRTSQVSSPKPVKKVTPIHTVSPRTEVRRVLSSLVTDTLQVHNNQQFQEHLQEWFFWQHVELKALCEFVSDKVVSNACTEGINCIPEIVEVCKTNIKLDSLFSEALKWHGFLAKITVD
jgi:hypothetical protein